MTGANHSTYCDMILAGHKVASPAGGHVLLRCVREFTTREGGVPFTVREGTVWYKASFEYALGGYEIALLEMVNGGAYTGIIARVRAERVNSDYFAIVPFMECPEPVNEPAVVQ